MASQGPSAGQGLGTIGKKGGNGEMAVQEAGAMLVSVGSAAESWIGLRHDGPGCGSEDFLPLCLLFVT